MTVDLESDLGADLDEVFHEVLPRLLDLFDKYDIKATFFVVSSLLSVYSAEINSIKLRGHEIASHSRSHSFLNMNNSHEEIFGSIRDFRLFGIDVKGFRAPGYVTVSSGKHLDMVKSAGYLYDSSFASYLPFRYNRRLFSEKVHNCRNDVIELPMPRLIWPSGLNGLSYLKLFYPFSFLFGFRYMFYLHPWEFISSSKLKARGFFENIVAFRCGDFAWRVFCRYLKRSRKKGVKWVSAKEYLEHKGFVGEE